MHSGANREHLHDFSQERERECVSVRVCVSEIVCVRVRVRDRERRGGKAVHTTALERRGNTYRGTSLNRNSASLGPYSRNMPRAMVVLGRGAVSYELGTP